MTNPAPKKLSRRDAIKLLGAAAGASVLANLPSKWSTPELASGVLPAHAQTSGYFGSIDCSPYQEFEPDSDQITFIVTLNPLPTPPTEILMSWAIQFDNADFDAPAPTSGTILTVNGVATLITPAITSSNGQGSVTVSWGFIYPENGPTNVCTTDLLWGIV